MDGPTNGERTESSPPAHGAASCASARNSAGDFSRSSGRAV